MNLQLFQAIPLPTLLVQPDGLIVEANPAATDLFGVPAGTLKGRAIVEFVTEPEAGVYRFLELCRRTREALPGNLTWRLGNGKSLPLRSDGGLLHPAADGRPAILYLTFRHRERAIERFAELSDKVLGLSREVQERRRAEAALLRSEGRYRTLVSAMSSVVFRTDSGGGFAEPQPSWEEFTGQKWPEYQGFGGFTAIHPDDRKEVEILWRDALETGKILRSEHRLWNAGSGTYHWCVVRAAPWGEGRTREWVGTATDIDRHRRLEEQLRQTQKLESLGVLAGGVAHDFNNLLVGILGNASLVLEALSSNHPARNMLRDVIAASESAAHLTKQLLAYAGKGKFVLEPVDLSDLVRQIASLIQASIPKNVQLRLELQPRLPCVEADLSQLQQLVMNLVINGAEAVPEDRHGTVLVTTGVQEVDEAYISSTLITGEVEPGSYVTLEVHDTGSGIPADVLAKMFDPFFTTKFTGRGLGLAAVHGIVRGHRGAMRVYSTPGQGTTFKVLFPASDEVPVKAEVVPEETEATGTATVLVVDDENVVRRTAKSMLERFGYSVILAENGQECVDLFRVLSEKIAVVLLDMTMPVLSGEETFRQLRSIKPEVRVILSSGYNEVEAVRRFAGKGLAGFIQKPYTAVALEQKIRSVLSEGENRVGRVE